MFDASRIKLIIFDFDGVIVESNGVKDGAFRTIFNRFKEQGEDAYQYHQKNVSLSRYAKFDYLLEKIGRPEDQELKNQLLADFSNATLELMRSVPFINGAKACLEELKQKFPLYLLSVTPIDDLNSIIDHLNIRSYFKEIYGCPPWNKTDAIRNILQKENISAEQTVMVGDSYGDQRAAAETRIHFIGRDSGLGFEDPQPQCIIPDLAGLSAVLKID